MNWREMGFSERKKLVFDETGFEYPFQGDAYHLLKNLFPQWEIKRDSARTYTVSIVYNNETFTVWYTDEQSAFVIAAMRVMGTHIETGLMEVSA